MGYARKSLICLNDTPYYHVVARCVRRAWLCGYDEYAGRDYSHRKTWVLERLKRLSGVFSIDLCAYAVMSNHYHLVLHVDRARSVRWTEEEVIERWGKIFGLPALIRRWQNGMVSDAEAELAMRLIERWRRRLSDVSWYMRCLNEWLARRANDEDHCTGRFWEGRFKSQALLDEAGLLTAMAYVDLNPVRAGVAETPETSEFTSIQARIEQLRSPAAASGQTGLRTIPPRVQVELLAFRDHGALGRPAIPSTLTDYLELLDWTGRIIRPDKSGVIDERAPPILVRMSVDPGAWQATMRPAGNAFGRALGRLDQLREHAKSLGQSWVKGLHQAERLYGTA